MIKGHRFNDLTGKRYGKLRVIKVAGKDKNDRYQWLCKCKCKNKVIVTGIYLTNGDTKSCGCLKKKLEDKHLREKYDEKRIDGVAMQLFKGKKPRKDSSTGYRGVSRYFTRVSKQERYRAWIQVKGKRYYKSGFKTAKDAYYNGRLVLEDEHLPVRKEK